MTKLDYIVVGLGIAGLHIASELQRRNKRFCVFEPGGQSASKVAAGIINPITGRNYTKSWLVDELLPSSVDAYRRLEEKLGIRFMHHRPIVRPLRTVIEENAWLHRMADAEYADYIRHGNDCLEMDQAILPPLSYGFVSNALQIDTSVLIERYTADLSAQSILKSEPFLHENLKRSEDQWLYEDLAADAVLFCEGYKVRENPYFNFVDIEPTRGEALIIHTNQTDEMTLRDKCFVCPAEEGHWVGSGYEKNSTDESVQPEGRARLETTLQSFFLPDYEVTDHRAGIRPCTYDRKPVMGRHPQWPSLILFNGMGTKGTSLAPYFARHLVSHLEEGTDLLEAVSIHRFVLRKESAIKS